MIPSKRLEILHDFEKFFLNFIFRERILFPILWIFLVLEHVDTCMSDEWETFMDFFDSLESFPFFCVWKSENEVDVYGNSILSVLISYIFYTFKSSINILLIGSVNFFETQIIECLDSYRETIDSKIKNSSNIFFRDIFRICFQRYFFGIFVIRKAFENFSNLIVRKNRWSSSAEIESFYISSL